MADFRLIETMRVAENREVHLLDRHLARLSRSAAHFSFTCDLRKIRETVAEAALYKGAAACLRLTLADDGALTLQFSPLPVGYVQRLRLSSVTVNSTDRFLFHKTTRRAIYEQARKEFDEQTDVLLINERGEITETTIMNVAVLRDGRWVTPHLSCGLLAGVMREELLSRGEIVEGIVLASDLESGERVRCFNSVRGIYEVELLQ